MTESTQEETVDVTVDDEPSWYLWTYSLAGQHIVTVFGQSEPFALINLKRVVDENPEANLKGDQAFLLSKVECPFDLGDAPNSFITSLCSMINDTVLAVDMARARMMREVDRANQSTRH